MGRVPSALSLIALSLACAASTAAALDEHAARTLGRTVRDHVSRNEPGALWRTFDSGMRDAMTDSTTFAGALAEMHAGMGAIVEVIDETTECLGAGWGYRARCRFADDETVRFLAVTLDPEGKVSGLRVYSDEGRAYPSPRKNHEQKTRLTLPFEGPWAVCQGGRSIENNYHAVSKTQHFAMDVIVVEEGSSHRGDPGTLASYHAYGREILAPAPGRVVHVVDGHPDQAIGATDAANPFGNVVVIDHGNGEFSALAHLQPGTIAVEEGVSVERGQLIGLCGNSGNTSEPHLHYQLQDGPSLTEAHGLPHRFHDVIVNGEHLEVAEPVKDQVIAPAPEE